MQLQTDTYKVVVFCPLDLLTLNEVNRNCSHTGFRFPYPIMLVTFNLMDTRTPRLSAVVIAVTTYQ